MSSPPAAPPAAGSLPPVRRPSIVRRVLNRLFPAETDEPRTSTGFAADVGNEYLWGLLAVIVAAAAAGLWLWITRVYPVPPGEDPSTWILTSYAYIGLPHPAVSSLYGYPPASFPPLGLAVLAGGGPLVGGRIYTVAILLTLGVATYLFGRTLLVRPPLALLGEGLLLAEPDFSQIYYFGGYPNLFALAFMLLALAFLLRYLRTRRPGYLLAFWGFTAVTAISHSLTAVILAATLVVLFFGLIVVGRFPRKLIASKWGAGGLALVVGALAAYYGSTSLFGIGHPAYLVANTVSGTSLLPAMLTPFHIPVLVDAATGQSAFALSAGQTVAIVGASALVILLSFFLLLWRRPKALTTPWLVLAASFLAVFIGALAAYFLGISTDYRRFQYFLYVPGIFVVMMFADLLVEWVTGRPVAGVARVAAERLPAPVVRSRRRPVRWHRFTDPILLVLVVGILLLATVYYTVPAGTTFETYYARNGHDSTFLTAMNAIGTSGIDGNILSSTILAGHWPSTVTGDRVTYEVSFFAGNAQQYTPSQVAAGELTTLTLGARYSATNELVVASIPGTDPGTFNSSPVYGVFTGDFYRPILRLPTPSLLVTFANGTQDSVSPLGSPAPLVDEISNGTGYSLTFGVLGATVVETVQAAPTAPTLSIAFHATATGPENLTQVAFRLGTVSQVQGNVSTNGTPGTFTWQTNSRTGNVTTFGNVTPAAALSSVVPYNSTPGAAASVGVKALAAGSNGSPSIDVALSLTSPGLFNVFPRPGPWISADQVWANWTARFAILYNSTSQNGLGLEAYLETEYTAAVYVQSGLWIVMVLPSPLPAPLAGPPVVVPPT